MVNIGCKCRGIAAGGTQDPSALAALDSTEKERVRRYVQARMGDYDNLFYQYRLGYLDDEFYQTRVVSSIKRMSPIGKSLDCSTG